MSVKLVRRLRSPSNPSMTWTTTLSISDTDEINLRMQVNDVVVERKISSGLRGTLFAVINGIYLHERELLASFPDLLEDGDILLADTIAALDTTR